MIVFQKKIIIEEGATAHSSPIVTLNTGPKYKIGVLAQFLHEQIHWIENGREQEMVEAIGELKIIYPNAPIGRPEGGVNEKSTYRHLIICRLEFLALTELLGLEKAKEVVLKNSNYTWIREILIKEGEKIDVIIHRYNFNI